MKKIWKNLCAVSMALACGIGVSACGEEEKPVPKDLDGDGVISTWETLFEDVTTEESHEHPHLGGITLYGDVVNINSVEDFLAINEKTATRHVFVLNTNIDLGGKEVCINLGKSDFFGAGYVISNFKLGSANTDNLVGTNSKKNVKCLFYNGTGVYSTRVFMGVQNYTLDTADSTSYNSVSLCFNVPFIYSVRVRGKLAINVVRKDGRQSANLDASVLYSGMRYEVIQSDESVLEFDNNVTIKESFVDGVVDFVEDKNTMVSANIGVIASKLPSNSMVYNTGATAIINAGISMNETNIGGIVGLNQGFVTSCVYSGNIVLNNNQNNYADAESVGGIVGYNDTLAEVKNCQTHGTISLKNTEKEVVTQSHYYMGGVVGTNNAGVLELCQSDALMQFENLNSVFAGGMVGCNRLGIVSYAISRGSIELKDVESITTAQVVGYSVSGYLEKVVTTTSINIDNSASLSRKVDVGLVTVFDSIENSPNFNKILADGTTEVYTRAVDGSVNYNLGLRYSYQKIVGQEDEEDIYATVLPNIFENVYRTSGLSFKKYKLEDNEKKEETIEISYVNKIGVSTPTPRWMIDYLDFKNYLNHNEVSLGTNLSLAQLQFTITNESERLTSYFGYSRYNGELAYYDHEFTEYYTHIESAFGSCEYDPKDEMMSFIYGLVNGNNGKNKENYVIKLNDTYLGKHLLSEEGEVPTDGLHLNTYLFMNKIRNAFTCLNATPTLTKLSENGENLDEDDSGLLTMKYLQVTFADEKNNYIMKFDISNLENEQVFVNNEYMLYLTFTISAKIA